MKLDTTLPNTLIISLYTQGNRAVALGNLQTGQELIAGILETKGEPLQSLCLALEEAKIILPRQVAIYSNDEALVRLYTFPIRLPLPKPPNLDSFFKERMGKFRQGMWVIPDSVAVQPESIHWRIIRQLMEMRKWSIALVSADRMTKGKELWQRMYS